MAFIRGYLHTGNNLFDAVKNVITEFKHSDETPEHKRDFDECWIFPPAGKYCGECIFLSASIKLLSLPYFKSLIQKIGEDVFEDDYGEIQLVTGRFELTIDGESDNHIWTLKNGHLDTSKRVPHFISP